MQAALRCPSPYIFLKENMKAFCLCLFRPTNFIKVQNIFILCANSPCRRFNQSGGSGGELRVSVGCGGLGLLAPPAVLPPHTVYVDLSDNKVTFIVKCQMFNFSISNSASKTVTL